MTAASTLVAAAASELIGAPFCLNGRDPDRGLDCVGVLVVSLAAAGRFPRIPLQYSLRRSAIDDFVVSATEIGLLPVADQVKIGDIVVARPGPAQFHAAIAIQGRRFVHAHAGLRRVVASPAPLPWPLDHHWRIFSTY